jgi:predicted DNA-binding protein
MYDAMKKETMEQVPLRMPPSLVTRTFNQAVKEGRTPPNLIRRALVKYLDEREGKDND